MVIAHVLALKNIINFPHLRYCSVTLHEWISCRNVKEMNVCVGPGVKEVRGGKSRKGKEGENGVDLKRLAHIHEALGENEAIENPNAKWEAGLLRRMQHGKQADWIPESIYRNAGITAAGMLYSGTFWICNLLLVRRIRYM